MSQTIKIDNFNSLNIKESSTLSADVAAGVTAITLDYTDDFAALDYLYLGRVGSEGGEVCIIQSISGAKNVTLTAPGTRKPHNQFDQVRSLFGDKIKVYRAPNVNGYQPADGAFTLLATVQVDYDQTSTIYTDAAGSADYWYKFTYFNSTNSGESNLADSTAVRGGSGGNYASVESIRKEAGLVNNKWITDADINEKRLAAQAEINSTLSGMYTLPFTAPINALIAEITRKLAAGFVLLEDYGLNATGTSKDGDAKLKEARARLAQLKSKELVLTDVTGIDTSISGSGGPAGWPDASTAGALPEDGGGARIFRISDVY